MGQRVICKYKNGRYYHSGVLELSPTTFYEVVFDDGSYSDNLFPEDIEVNWTSLNFYLRGQLKGLDFKIYYILYYKFWSSNSVLCIDPLRTVTVSDSDPLPKEMPFRCDGRTA